MFFICQQQQQKSYVLIAFPDPHCLTSLNMHNLLLILCTLKNDKPFIKEDNC